MSNRVSDVLTGVAASAIASALLTPPAWQCAVVASVAFAVAVLIETTLRPADAADSPAVTGHEAINALLDEKECRR